MKIYRTNSDYLLKLAELSRSTRMNKISELYGVDFAKLYPDLAKELPFYDKELTIAAKNAVIAAIERDCPEEKRPLMREHIKYMEEISALKEVDPTFAGRFAKITDMAMEDYKRSIRPESAYIKFNSFKSPGKNPELDTQASSSIAP